MAGKRHDAGVHAQLQMGDSQGNGEHQRGLCMHGKHSRQGTVPWKGHGQMHSVVAAQHMAAVLTSRLSAAGDCPLPSRQWTFWVLALKKRQKASPPMPAHPAQLSAHSLTALT